MTTEQFEDMKEMYLNNIKRFINETGGLFPHVTIFATKVEAPDEISIIHVPIPEELMKNDRAKDKFVDVVIPELGSKLKDMFTPKAVLWASEAWMYKTDKYMSYSNRDKIDLKAEVLIITIDKGEEKTDVIIYEMMRTKMEVNKEGEMKGEIKLKLYKGNNSILSNSGRFTGLFNKLVTA
jgi:hypothetical protein